MSIGWNKEASPFHAGELAIQERLGLRERMDELGRRMIRDHLPEQHREFYRALPFLIVATLDEKQRPWASLLAGPPGFIEAPDAGQLVVATQPLFASPLAEHLAPGAPIGVLGMIPESRRRNRLTGHIAATGDSGFAIAVDQTFGNCPQYIQARGIEARPALATPAAERPLVDGTVLDEEARELIGHADTFFIASAYQDGSAGPQGGADASHRGGRPGFVRVEGNTLTFPDFSGNNHFNTLGNIEASGRAGLLFIDFDNGDLLYITGTAEVVWDDPAIDAFEGALRLVQVEVEAWRRVEDSLPLRFLFQDYSPFLEGTGDWQSGAEITEATPAGYHPMTVAGVTQEARDVRSFYLRPADGSVPGDYLSGQFLPIRLDTPDGVLERVYSLSAAPDGVHYRLSVKRDGEASGYLHESVTVGDTLHAKLPAGPFVLDDSSERPVVMAGAGIGVTPLLAMAQALVSAAERGEHSRTVHFVYGDRDGSTRPFAGELRQLASRYAGFKLHLVLSRPGAADVLGADFHSEGRVSIELLKRLLPLDDYDYYLCGPGGFMAELHGKLIDLNIQPGRIHSEAFGPAAVQPATPADTGETAATPVTVEFARSGKVTEWTAERGSLLELAETEGIDAPFSCRAGACGSCMTQVTDGGVRYPQAPAVDPEGGALICCSVPDAAIAERLVLDL